MKIGFRQVAAVGFVTLALGVPMAPTASAAKIATTCKAAEAKTGRLRFNYVNGTIQVCAKSGKAYKWRAATTTEAQKPYRAYLQPMASSSYIPIPESVTGDLVVGFAGLFGSSEDGAAFAGFVTSGLKQTGSPESLDALLIVLPFSKLGRATADIAALRAEGGGTPAVIAGKEVSVENDGDSQTVVYIGPTAMVFIVGDAADTTHFPVVVSDWLTAHPGT
jgi:hypothetical protein